MITLTDAAQKRLDEYLQQVRACLQGCETVDANEVQHDITEHIDRELEGSAEPVSVSKLDAVLRRLGSPSQWIPPEEATWWRKTTSKFQTDLFNWPMAYIAFGLFVLWLLIPIGPRLLWPARFWSFAFWDRFVRLILLLASFCVARAAISKAGGHKELGARRWLIYTPLIFVYVPLFLLILLWPVLPTFWGPLGWRESILGSTRPGFYWGVFNYMPRIEYLHGFGNIQPTFVLLLWWIVLGGLLLIWPGLLRIIFRPFADRFNRKWAGLLLVIALMLLIAYTGLSLQGTWGRFHTHRTLRW